VGGVIGIAWGWKEKDTADSLPCRSQSRQARMRVEAEWWSLSHGSYTLCHFEAQREIFISRDFSYRRNDKVKIFSIPM